MTKLGVIFGGKSGEHDISLMSAASVLRAIDTNKFEIVMIGITKEGKWLSYEGDFDKIENNQWEAEAKPFNIGALKETIDFALPILHGPNGEDGTIQGLFEMLDVPYAGCGVLGSAAAMDKVIAKDVFARAGLPICGHVLVLAEEYANDCEGRLDYIEAGVPYPVFVKPANMGSSVGISKAKNREELKAAMEEALKYDRRIIIEEGLDVREVETAIIGNADLQVGAVGEIAPSEEFYSYNAKYFDGGKTDLMIPANITKEQEEEIKEVAKKAYLALDCAGFARVDCFIEKKTGKVYINEINTIPGFTAFSMFPSLFAEVGVPYAELIERIVEFGYERYNAKNNRDTSESR